MNLAGSGVRRQFSGFTAVLGVLIALIVTSCIGRDSSTDVAGDVSPRAASSAVRLTPADDAERRILQALPQVDTSRAIVPLAEIESGGVLPDEGIPSLHDPVFDSIEAASEWLAEQEPVIVLKVAGDARIYPIQILIWHEVVNDDLGGLPVLVTFCPLCNAALAFDRRVDGVERSFGVSGLLRESDLLLYDYTSITLWQQLTGEAIVGTDAGRVLDSLPAQIVSFGDARATYPAALVLSRRTGHDRNYGRNPYGGYDRIDSDPVFSTSFDDGRLPAKTRVLAIEIEGDVVAIPFGMLKDRVVVHAEVGSVSVVALWQPGTSTALDASVIVKGRDVGAAGAFVATLDGAPITFTARRGSIYDLRTGSRWNAAGVAVTGPLKGARLQPVVSGSHFWFAWSVFKPHVRLITE